MGDIGTDASQTPSAALGLYDGFRAVPSLLRRTCRACCRTRGTLISGAISGERFVVVVQPAKKLWSAL